MKKVTKLSLALLLSTSLFLASCEKEELSGQKSTTNPSGSTDKGSDILVANTIADDKYTDVSLMVNGKQLVDNLGFKEVSEYLDVDAGEVRLDLMSKDGKLLATSRTRLVEKEVYDIVLSIDEDGVTPKIQVLEIDILNLQDADLLSSLGKGGQVTELFGVNFLNNLGGLNGDDLLLGADYLNSANKLVPGLLQLDRGVLSNPVMGNNDILKNIDLISSDLSLTELVEKLSKQTPAPGLLNLGGLLGLTNLGGVNNGLLDGLLNMVQGLLGGILGGSPSADPLKVLNAPGLDNLNLVDGNQYTVIVFNSVDKVQQLVIDQTKGVAVPSLQ